MLRTVDAAAPIVMSGDGNGLVALASAGMLDPGRPVLYSASAAERPAHASSRSSDEPNAQLVVSDTNRRQARRWGSVRENDGYTERAGETPLEKDPADNRLELFPDADDDAVHHRRAEGGATARASSYGNRVSYTAADRAENAIDGDPSTTWQVGAFSSVLDEYLEIAYDLRSPPTAHLLQTQRPTNRSITEVSLSFDGGDPMLVTLDDTSRTPPGQEITFPSRTFSTLRITIENTDIGERTRWEGISGVGIAEVTHPRCRADHRDRPAAGRPARSPRVAVGRPSPHVPLLPPGREPVRRHRQRRGATAPAVGGEPGREVVHPVRQVPDEHDHPRRRGRPAPRAAIAPTRDP